MKCDAYHVFFKNLANPVKTNLISELKLGSLSVNELVKKTGFEQSKISHALANLRFCNLVKVKQDGRERVYSLNKKTILPILKIIDRHRTNYCPGCKGRK